MNGPSADRMLIFHHPGTTAFRAPDGVFEAPSSDLLEVQTPHPEGPERIANTAALLERGPAAESLDWRRPEPANDTEILEFHTEEYLDCLKEADRGGQYLTRTTYLPKGGLEGVRLAAGAAIAAANAVMAEEALLAYSLVRPPSHHAQPSAADGYCVVNGTALAALAARASGACRVAIVDWDVHHGNGTQEGFYERDDMLTVSLHMDHGAWGASHPQTGGVDEIGRGAGEGFNLNLPLPFGFGDHGYALVFDRCVAPVLRRFAPEVIVLANGQDASQFDPNGRQCISMAGFHALANRLRAIAQNLCGGKIIIVQEGGYNPAYAPFCAYAVVAGLLSLPIGIDDPLAFYPEDRAAAEGCVDRLLARHPLRSLM